MTVRIVDRRHPCFGSFVRILDNNQGTLRVSTDLGVGTLAKAEVFELDRQQVRFSRPDTGGYATKICRNGHPTVLTDKTECDICQQPLEELVFVRRADDRIVTIIGYRDDDEDGLREIACYRMFSAPRVIGEIRKEDVKVLGVTPSQSDLILDAIFGWVTNGK